MNIRHQLRHPLDSRLPLCREARHLIALPLFDNRGCAKRQQPDNRADLQARGGSVRKAQQVVVEAVLLIPQAVGTVPVDRCSNPEEIVDEPGRDVLE